MFVDARFIAAVLLREAGHENLIARLERASIRQTSIAELYTAVLILAERIGVGEAGRAVEGFAEAAALEIGDVRSALLPALDRARDRLGGHADRLGALIAANGGDAPFAKNAALPSRSDRA